MHSETGYRGGGRSLLLAKVFGILLILSMLLTGQGPAPAQALGGLHYASPSGLPTNNCLSWAQACDLETALTWPVDWPGGKELWVMRGVYVPTKNIEQGVPRSKTFALPDGAQVYGGFAGTETNRNQRNPRLNPTILSGNIDGDGTLNSGNAYHVVYYTYPSRATLDGFTITGGYADGSITDVYRPDGFGGGLYSSGSVSVKNVTFRGNWAKYGGGVWLKFHDASLANVTVAQNYAKYDGGGIYNAGTSSAFGNMTFYGNKAAGDGGALFNDGGSPTLRNVTMSADTATHGAGMANSSSVPVIYDSILWENGVFYNTDSFPTLYDSIVYGGCPSGATCVNVLTGDPHLGGLANNGGYTDTMALGPGSAAIDAGGVNSACASTDQRGITRPQGTACDIGAYEAEQETISGNIYGTLADFSSVTVSWAGAASTGTTHPGVGDGSSAAYSITVPYGWSGTVTPSLDGYTFVATGGTDDHRDYTNVTADILHQNYDMKGPVNINGNIYGTLADFSSVTVSWAGATSTGTTHPGVGDGSGAAYSITVPYGWSGDVTPSLDGYTFTPDHLEYADITADTLHQNYTMTAITYTISGTIRGMGCGDLLLVNINYDDGGPQVAHPTDCSGAYSITVPWHWSGTVTPTLTGYEFLPVSRDYSSVGADIANQDYGIPVNINGNIFGSLADFSSVTVSWAGAEGTGETHPGVGDGSSAGYSIAVPYGWSGTVTPSLDGYAFTPDHLDYANVIADTLHQNYSVAASLGLVQSLGASSLLGPGGAAGPDTLITSDPPDPNSTTAIFTFTSPDSPVTFECQLDAAGFEACTSPTAYDALTDGSHTFEVRAVDDQGTPDPSPSSQSWVINGPPQVLDQGLKTTLPAPNDILAEGQVVTAGVSEFTITFSGPLYDPSGDTDPNDVTNPANYLLVRDDGDGFQTLSCKDGVQSGDTAITIDSVTYDDTTFTVTLGVNGGLPLSNGIYRMYACGTTSLVDAGDHSLKLAGDGKHAGTDYVRDFIVADAKSGGGNRSGSAREDATLATSAVKLPTTGFPPGVVTLPAGAPHEHYAAAGGMVLEIPALSVRAPIVGIARQGDGWQDLFGLGNNAGYLEGSAYPTWPGNTVLTGHVIDAGGAPGIFANLKELQANDRVSIHFGGQVFVYVVRANTLVAPVDVAAVFEHKSYNWLTLLTCEDYNPTNSVYAFRRVVRAVLISVVPEQ